MTATRVNHAAETTTLTNGDKKAYVTYLMGVVTINVEGGSVWAKGWTWVGTLPSKYRPSRSIHAPAVHTTVGSASGMMEVKDNGQVGIYNPNNSTQSMGASISYNPSIVT